MRPNGIKLSRPHQAALYVAFLALYVTGVAWYVLHDGLILIGQVEDGWSSPVAPFLLKIHGAAAMLALLVLGSLVPQHIKWAWKGKMNRSTGGLMLSTQAILVVTGYALYYCGDEGMRSFASGLHLVVGAAFPLVILWHVVEGRRQAVAMKVAARSTRLPSDLAKTPVRTALPEPLAPEIASPRRRV